jgi:orotate phosphoribosyltransferase
MSDEAIKTAEYLMQINAIKLQKSHPFIFTSKKKSPLYFDNFKTIFFP